VGTLINFFGDKKVICNSLLCVINWDAYSMKTYSAKPKDIERKWCIVDAEGLVLGRMASIISMRLRGKHKPSYTPHMDCGDHIIVINADKIQLTGRKRTDKLYYRHTGYPGGIKSRSAGQILEGAHPERIVIKAIERMLSRNPLGTQQMRKLHVYAGADHPHEAQNPEILDIAAMNTKNVRSA
jgi:large subunit ribosomal protein L13